MNIQGFAFKKNQDIKSSYDLGKMLDLELVLDKEVYWTDHETGFHEDDKILILNHKDTFVVYPSTEVMEVKEFEYINLLKNSEEGFSFALGETSMIFMFSWYEKNKFKGEDLYIFSQNEYEIEGDNKLNLTTESDIIFDGYFPYLSKFFEKDLEDERAQVFSYKILEKTDSNSRLQSQNEPDAKNYSVLAKELLFQDKLDNGIDEIYKLRNISMESFQHGGKPPEGYNMEYLKQIPIAQLKSEIKALGKRWQRRGSKIEPGKYYKIMKVALAWTFHDFQPRDLKSKWWQF